MNDDAWNDALQSSDDAGFPATRRGSLKLDEHEPRAEPAQEARSRHDHPVVIAEHDACYAGGERPV
jgi:hypothetical protein